MKTIKKEETEVIVTLTLWARERLEVGMSRSEVERKFWLTGAGIPPAKLRFAREALPVVLSCKEMEELARFYGGEKREASYQCARCEETHTESDDLFERHRKYWKVT